MKEKYHTHQIIQDVADVNGKGIGDRYKEKSERQKNGFLRHV